MGNNQSHVSVSGHRARMHRESSSNASSSAEHVSASSGSHDSQSVAIHPRTHRSYSHSARQRQDSCSSAFSTSLEGAYWDSGDGMTPSTFGGSYQSPVPRVSRPQCFDAAHGNKLRMPIDSKLGSGFDLDWQYDANKVKKILAKRSINPDHPCYAWLAAKAAEQQK